MFFYYCFHQLFTHRKNPVAEEYCIWDQCSVSRRAGKDMKPVLRKVTGETGCCFELVYSFVVTTNTLQFTVIFWLAVRSLIAENGCRHAINRCNSLLPRSCQAICFAWLCCLGFPQMSCSRAVANFMRINSCSKATSGPWKFPQERSIKQNLPTCSWWTLNTVWYDVAVWNYVG